jgi:hypothetical protein
MWLQSSAHRGRVLVAPPVPVLLSLCRPCPCPWSHFVILVVVIAGVPFPSLSSSAPFRPQPCCCCPSSVIPVAPKKELLTVVVCCPPSTLSGCCPSTHGPSREQLLAAVGMGAESSMGLRVGCPPCFPVAIVGGDGTICHCRASPPVIFILACASSSRIHRPG